MSGPYPISSACHFAVCFAFKPLLQSHEIPLLSLEEGAVLRLDPISRLVRQAIVTTFIACCSLSGSLFAQHITVVSWGGSYARACEEAYHKPFEVETGIRVRLEDYNGGLAQVRSQVDAGAIYWDVVDLELADAIRGCDEGLFEFLDPASIAPAPDGSAIEEDFYPDTLGECGLGTVFYSTVFAYSNETIGDGKPKTIEDFFDLEKFPGRRGMRRSPAANLEFALIADGVPVDQVYATLDTEEGVERAFRKLDSIKHQVIWWQAGAQPPQMLADGEVVMTTAYNGRIFNAQVLENQPFVVVWDGQVLDTGQLAIVSGTPRLAEAQRFIEFASRPSSLAGIGRYIAYSPTRRSADSLVSTHLETGVQMRPHMPNTPEHTQRALRSDWEWWSEHGDDMNERFVVWLLQ